jgi:hypothetical protein
LINELTLALTPASDNSGTDDFTGKTSVSPASAVPEPASLTLLGLGAAGLPATGGAGGSRRRRPEQRRF